MRASDLERVLGIAETLPEAPQWPASAYLSAIDPVGSIPRIALVASVAEDDGTVGFLVAGLVPPEAELETIGVSGALQGKGIGKSLLLSMRPSDCAVSLTEPSPLKLVPKTSETFGEMLEG